jgi:hypothetical protein
MDFKALCTCYKAGLTKTLRIMKITAIILLSACITASAKGYTQNVTLSEKNYPYQKCSKIKQIVSTFVYQTTGPGWQCKCRIAQCFFKAGA